MKVHLIAITAALLGSGLAMAGTTAAQVPDGRFASTAIVPVQQSDRWDDRSVDINGREARIKGRIQRGLHDGKITEWEARRLYRELADIESKERAYRSDGRLNRREREELARALDRLAEHVRDQARDDQRRY